MSASSTPTPDLDREVAIARAEIHAASTAAQLEEAIAARMLLAFALGRASVGQDVDKLRRYTLRATKEGMYGGLIMEEHRDHWGEWVKFADVIGLIEKAAKFFAA